ncbi:hypothetical protein LJC31_04820 [Synergistaceae bacterium OttesenSCG-928-I11]|nr:hypothetical protein [Synergistaceae bacterium OttesenSCG-928-I11]
MLPAIVSFFSYLALILVVAVPGVQRQRQSISGSGVRGVAALLCALCATLFLPWTGVGVLPFQTWPFYPFLALALLLNACRSRPGFRASFSFFIVLALFVLQTDRFVISNGLPGDRASIESAGMILRLESIRNIKLVAAMFFIFASLFLSFLHAYCDDAAGNVVAFAFSSLLSLVFFRIDTTGSLNIFPPISLVLNFTLSFGVAIALREIIRMLAARRHEKIERSLSKSFFFSVALSLLGGYLLLTSL